RCGRCCNAFGSGAFHATPGFGAAVDMGPEDGRSPMGNFAMHPGGAPIGHFAMHPAGAPHPGLVAGGGAMHPGGNWWMHHGGYWHDHHHGYGFAYFGAGLLAGALLSAPYYGYGDYGYDYYPSDYYGGYSSYGYGDADAYCAAHFRTFNPTTH